MKIKKINEDFEFNINKNDEKIQTLKDILYDAWSDGRNSGVGEESGNETEFGDFWNESGDKLIQEIGLIDNEPRGNIREILPQMVRLSNNSQITQMTANRIADKFTKSEFNDFKRWLQLIEQNNQNQKRRY